MSWKRRSPKTRTARRALKARCGAKCFLMPKRKPAPGFPICNKACKPDCQGLRAAFSRAKQTHRPKIAAKAVRLACRQGCAWTERKDRC